MARRRYLLGYDISDPARLRQVHLCAKRYGYPLQYSLFVCDVDEMELTGLKWELSDLIHHRVDRVVLIDLGASLQEDRFEFLGVRPGLPGSGPTIV